MLYAPLKASLFNQARILSAEVSFFSALSTKHSTCAQAHATAMFKSAREGKTAAAREIRESIEGKTGQRPEEPEKMEVTVELANRLPWAQ